jgi:hypothetical protein
LPRQVRLEHTFELCLDVAELIGGEEDPDVEPAGGAGRLEREAWLVV